MIKIHIMMDDLDLSTRIEADSRGEELSQAELFLANMKTFIDELEETNINESNSKKSEENHG